MNVTAGGFDPAGLPWPLSHDFGMQPKWDALTEGWSDFNLYTLTFPILVVGYTLGCLPFILMDMMKLPIFEQHKLQGKYHPPSQVFWCYVKTQSIMWAVIGPIQLLSFPFFKVAGISARTPLPYWWQLAMQLATYFIIEDYGNYWIHRWLHTPWAYKKIHSKHHEYDTPIGPAASYAHPAEVILLGIPSFVGPAATGCHMVTCWIWFTIRQLEAVDTHSGYDFPWSPTKLIPGYGGAEHHDYHHWVGGKSTGNFASIFTWCDRIYQTDKGFALLKKRANGGKVKLS